MRSTAPGGVALRYNLVPLHNVQRVDFRGTPSLGLSERPRPERGDQPLRRVPAGRPRAGDRAVHRAALSRSRISRCQRLVPRRPSGTIRIARCWSSTSTPGRAGGHRERRGGRRCRPTAAPRFSSQIHAVPAQRYEPAEIAEALHDLRAEAAEEIALPGRRVVPCHGLRQTATSVDLTITLQVGPVVTIAFEGDPLPKEKRAELVPVAREASVDEDLIEDSIQRIRTFLNQQGTGRPTPPLAREEGDGTLRIVFTVRRGPQYRVGGRGVEVRGNQAVAARAVPARAGQAPGQRSLRGVEPVRGRQRDRRTVSAAWLRPGEGVRRGQRGGSRRPAPWRGVQPVITIVEGPLTRIGDVTFEGNTQVPADQLRALVTSVRDAPYYEPQGRRRPRGRAARVPQSRICTRQTSS